MAKPITPPNYQKDAVITPTGWRHPRTNELLISRNFTTEEIDEYNGNETVMLKESPTTMQEAKAHMTSDLQYDLHAMSKKQVESVGRQHGIELDRRKNKFSSFLHSNGLLCISQTGLSISLEKSLYSSHPTQYQPNCFPFIISPELTTLL